MEKSKKGQAVVAAGLTAALAFGSFGMANTAYADTAVQDNANQENQQTAKTLNHYEWNLQYTYINQSHTALLTQDTTFELDGANTKVLPALEEEFGPSYNGDHWEEVADQGKVPYKYTTDGIIFSTILSNSLEAWLLPDEDTIFATPLTFMVNLDCQGGQAFVGEDPANALYFYAGESASDYLPTPIRDGFDFEGWYTDEACTQVYSGAQIMGDMTLYAKWVPATHTVTFDDRLDSTENATATVNDGDTVTRPADPTNGSNYDFGGWWICDEDGNYVSEYDFDQPVTSDLTLYAKWIEKDQPIADPGSSEDESDQPGNASNDTTDEEASELPQTGDSTLPFAAGAGVAALAGAAGVITAMRKRNEQ